MASKLPPLSSFTDVVRNQAATKIDVEAVAKLHASGQSMILSTLASGSIAATAHSTKPTPGGLVEEKGRKRAQKGDLYAAESFAIASVDPKLKNLHRFVPQSRGPEKIDFFQQPREMLETTLSYLSTREIAQFARVHRDAEIVHEFSSTKVLGLLQIEIQNEMRQLAQKMNINPECLSKRNALFLNNFQPIITLQNFEKIKKNIEKILVDFFIERQATCEAIEDLKATLSETSQIPFLRQSVRAALETCQLYIKFKRNILITTPPRNAAAEQIRVAHAIIDDLIESKRIQEMPESVIDMFIMRTTLPSKSKSQVLRYAISKLLPENEIKLAIAIVKNISDRKMRRPSIDLIIGYFLSKFDPIEKKNSDSCDDPDSWTISHTYTLSSHVEQAIAFAPIIPNLEQRSWFLHQIFEHLMDVPVRNREIVDLATRAVQKIPDHKIQMHALNQLKKYAQ